MLELDGTILVLAISFIIFVIIMQKIFYSPMAEVREERNNYISGNVKLAEDAVEEANKLLKNHESEITQSRIKASHLVSQSTTNANKEKARILEEVSQKADEKINFDREIIQRDKLNAKEALRQDVLALAFSISNKILGEEHSISGVTPEMIDKVLKR